MRTNLLSSIYYLIYLVTFIFKSRWTVACVITAYHQEMQSDFMVCWCEIWFVVLQELC